MHRQPLGESSNYTKQVHFPIQNVEKMRLRMSSALVAPVMASMGRRAE